MMIEETEIVHKYLPMHYNCTPLENGVLCVSKIGMDSDAWEHLNNILREMFGERLININDQGENQTHNRFTILLKKKK